MKLDTIKKRNGNHLNLRKHERLLKALANRRRLAIIVLLQSGKPLNVSDVARGIGLSFKSTSRHLAVLYAADLLDREQEGLEAYYRLKSRLPKIARTVLEEF